VPSVVFPSVELRKAYVRYRGGHFLSGNGPISKTHQVEIDVIAYFIVGQDVLCVEIRSINIYSRFSRSTHFPPGTHGNDDHSQIYSRLHWNPETWCSSLCMSQHYTAILIQSAWVSISKWLEWWFGIHLCAVCGISVALGLQER